MNLETATLNLPDSRTGKKSAMPKSLIRKASDDKADMLADEELLREVMNTVGEGAWACSYKDVSRPFAKPENGQFSGKVINHFGDEVMRVFNVE